MRRLRRWPRWFTRGFGYARLVCLLLLVGFAVLRHYDPRGSAEALESRVAPALMPTGPQSRSPWRAISFDHATRNGQSVFEFAVIPALGHNRPLTPPEIPMVAHPNSLAGRDVASVIHPYTNLEAHKITGPTVIAKGEGVYVYDDSGKKYLEGMAGLWSTSLGFSEPRLVEAAIRQMRELPTYHTFNGRSNEAMIELAAALLKISPKGLGKVLFANSGSEANDQAAKVVWYYNNAIGRPRKKKIISRVRAYHGITVFSGSLTGLAPNHNDFDLPVGGVLRTDCPSHYLYGLSGESE